MKKLIALLLSLMMVVSLFAGCNGGGEDPTTTAPADSTPTTVPATTAPPVVAEALPESALLHYTFDDATGLTAVTQGDKAADSTNTGATYDIVPSEHDILFANGPVGQCVYLDGKYGIQLDMSNVNITDDSYSISFWYNADRVATYGPVVQMGRNIGKANTDATVTWLNWTKTTWGANSADIFPVIWNRNSSIGTDISADGVWPWMAPMDDLEHGKREWVMVTLVVDGIGYTCADDALPRVGASIYLDGELKHYADATNLFYQGVSPEIMLADGLEGYIGINYWDTIFKGYIDELVIYDEVLTAGQIKTLFEQGDKAVESVAPEYEWGGDSSDVTEPEPIVLPEIAADPNAIDVLGTPERTLGWWTDNTAGYELAEGGSLTLKLNNYSNAGNNWHNYVVALANTAVTTDLLANADNYAGYAEYCILRPDAYGWGDGSYAGTWTNSWSDWTEWLRLMTDAEVTIVLTRSGATVNVNTTFVGADGTTMTSDAVITTSLTAEAPCYVFVGGEGAYIELLSVE